jgi:hypothetical protein
MRLVLAAVLAAAPALLAGCGSPPQDTEVITQDDMLADLKRLLEQYATAKKGAAPKRLADITPLEPSYPAAHHGLASGKCVYAWGVGLGGGSAVLAYQKETPTDGGPVLLQDGTVTRMTAEEFRAAPKAGK